MPETTPEPLTEDARDALGDALYEAPHLVDKDGRSFGGYWGDVADALVARLAEEGWTLTLTRERQSHVIDLREDGWTIKHPLACRPNLFDCPVNKVAARDVTEPLGKVGQFVCGLDEHGHLTIGERVENPDA